jgi:pyridinium-3,5-biscarboxylic acid mononucleotide sulfurtransferase
MTLEQKFARLKKIISSCGSCLIAFSGGVDSAFLAKVATMVLPRQKLLVVTADSPTYPRAELLFSRKVSRQIGVRHRIIKTAELKNQKFASNTLKRCYFCKSELFKKLKEIAFQEKLNSVFEASTLSDDADYRPGARALKELEIRSPLKEAGLGKVEIRRLSRRLRLLTWDKPSQACLASRVPYGNLISRSILRRVEEAEAYLSRLGFSQIRVRDYQRLCRIEVPKKDIPLLLKNKERIVSKMKTLGYNYITADLEGFRSGSMNEGIKR